AARRDPFACRAARDRPGQVPALPAAGHAAVVAGGRQSPFRRAGARPVRLRRAEPAVRDPRRGPAGDRVGRPGQRDGAGRVGGGLRGRPSAGPAGAGGPRDPRRARRQARPRGDGPPGARVRHRRGRQGGRRRPLSQRPAGAPPVKKLFWGSAAALAWTHLGYPIAAAVAARLRPDPPLRGNVLPNVTVVVAAWNEEAVIARRLENLLVLDYPADRLEIVVASDASDDGTDAIVEEFAAREPRVRLMRCPRGGKVAAQNRAV